MRRALVCHPRLPTFDQDRGSQRVMETLMSLQESGWELKFIAGCDEGGARYRRELQQLGIATYVGFEHLPRLLEAHDFDLALLSFWRVAEQVMPQLRMRSPATRVIVDSQDLHFLREARRRCCPPAGANAHLPGGRPQAGGWSGGVLNGSFGDEMVRELNVYAAADAVLAVSDKEAAFLNDLFWNDKAHVLPLMEDLPVSSLPARRRRGLVFIGNFRHLPNAEAVEFLCGDVLPRLDPTLLVSHPIRIVGYGLQRSCDTRANLPGVQRVGWVPSIVPELHQARVAVVPLLHGAGVKGKLLQAFATRTPVVSTSIGSEGLAIEPGEHLLVADDPIEFAQAVTLLLTDDGTWNRLADNARQYVEERHGPMSFKATLDRIVTHTLDARSAPEPTAHRRGRGRPEQYPVVQRSIRELVTSLTLPGSTVAVVSKGDPELISFPDRQGWHFPRTPGGDYAGYHPADSAEAIEQLEAVRRAGASFLCLPSTAFWWLHHYPDLRSHLDLHHARVYQDEHCVLFALRAANATGVAPLDDLRPTLELPSTVASRPPGKVLVAGIYRSHQEALVTDAKDELGSSRDDVELRWVSIGPSATQGPLAELTVADVPVTADASQARSAALRGLRMADYDRIVLVEGGSVLPRGFLDALLDLQHLLDVEIAMPVLTTREQSRAPIQERHLGLVARRTDFVTVAPAVALSGAARDVLDAALNAGTKVDAAIAEHARRTRSCALLDAVPVHALSVPRASAAEQDAGAAHTPPNLTDTWIAEEDGAVRPTAFGNQHGTPEISIVVATYDRAHLLERCLGSFQRQTLDRSRFEVVVVDDGSSDATAEVCRRLADELPLRYLRIGHAGRATAKNVGVFAARSPLLLFFDDDDEADEELLAQHVDWHGRHPDLATAILGRTDWAPDLDVHPVMRFVTDIGRHLFSYSGISHGQELDYRYFWEGRVSCKRELLWRHGVHDQRLPYTIDIELAYRLADHGLKVIYNEHARSYMTRPVTFEQFRRRCEDKGRAQQLFARLHPDAEVMRYCKAEEAARLWAEARPEVDSWARQIEELEARFEETGDPLILDELHALYGRAFEAATAKGYVEARAAAQPAVAPTPPSVRQDLEPIRPDSADAPTLSVIVPVWNVTPELARMTERNLARLRELRTVDAELVLIENGSPYPAEVAAEREVRLERNLGVSPAWNLGAEQAAGAVLCFLNNDVEVEPGWDAALVEAALDGRRIAFPYTDHGDGEGFRRADTAGASGWCFALARTTFEELGGFDEAFAPAFWEDADYWMRAWKAGVEMSPVPAARVRHVRRSTARNHPEMDQLHLAHRHKFAWKHGLEPGSRPPYYDRPIVDFVGRALPSDAIVAGRVA